MFTSYECEWCIYMPKLLSSPYHTKERRLMALQGKSLLIYFKLHLSTYIISSSMVVY